MTEAEYKRAIFNAIDEDAKTFLKAFAAVFGPLRRPRNWTVDGVPVGQEDRHGGK